MANFYTQGEVCSNGTRVFVHRVDRRAEFLDRLVARTAKMVVGDPTDPATHVGALISAEHLAKVLGVHRAPAWPRGPSSLCGGRRPRTTRRSAAGCFVEPTVFDDCTDDMTIVREEIFGPVMTVLEFDDEDEVVARANDTPFGLAGRRVHPRPPARPPGRRGASRPARSGSTTTTSRRSSCPSAACKQSGIGRENGAAAIEHYTQLKSVYVEMGDVDDLVLSDAPFARSSAHCGARATRPGARPCGHQRARSERPGGHRGRRPAALAEEAAAPACVAGERDEAASYDYVIVGGGSAGSALANRLSADERQRCSSSRRAGPTTAGTCSSTCPPR